MTKAAVSVERARAKQTETEREAAPVATARADTARDAARAELADWTSGGPLARA